MYRTTTICSLDIQQFVKNKSEKGYKNTTVAQSVVESR